MKHKILKIFTLVLVFAVFLSVLPTQTLLASDMQTEEIVKSVQENANQKVSDQLQQAVETVNAARTLVPDFSKDKNILVFMKNWLKKQGFSGIEVSFAQDFTGNNASILKDGTIHYFFADPDTDVTISNNNLENLKVVFQLTDQNETVATAEKTVQLKWDEDRIRAAMTERGLDYISENLDSLVAPNKTAKQVTQNFELPQLINGKGWLKASWISNNAALQIGQPKNYKSNYPITVKQSDTEQIVTLKAVIELGKSTDEPIRVTRDYEIRIPAIDLTAIKAKMQNDLDQYFVPEVLTYISPYQNIPFDANHVLYNIQLPIARNIQKDTKNSAGQTVSKGIKDLNQEYITSGSGFSFYSFSNVSTEQTGTIAREGFTGKVTLPKADEKPSIVNLTMTLTHKNYDLSVSKTIPLTLNPIDYNELMQKVNRQAELMQLAKESFFQALNGNPGKTPNADADHITENLSNFQEIRFKNPDDPNDKTLEYIYNYADKVEDGIVLTALPNSETQEAWRLLRSSHPAFIQHETLNLGEQPNYDTKVRVDAILTSPSFEQYRNYFGNIENDDSKLLASLFDQPISQDLTIIGRKGPLPAGQNDQQNIELIIEGSKIIEKKEEQATANEIWLKKSFSFEKGTAKTIQDLLIEALPPDQVTVDINGGMLQSIKLKDKPENRNQVTNGPNSYWMFYEITDENPEFRMTEYGVTQNIPSNVTSIKLKYVNDPGYPFSVKDEILDPDNAVQLTDETDWWTGYRGDEQNNSPNKISENLEQATQQKVWSYITDEKNDWGGAANLSDMLIIQDKIYVAVKDRLIVLSTDGEKINETKLKGSIGYISRPAYRGGLILIPLEGGAVQAVRPDSLETVWVSGSIDAITLYQEDAQGDMVAKSYPLQNQGTTYIKNNIAYIPLSAVENFKSVGGVLRAIDLTTGCEKWRFVNNSAGFYWAGATQIGDYILIGDDSGQVIALKTDGSNIYQPIIFNENKSPIRSTMVQYGGKLYFTTTDGMLHELNFDATNGEFGAHRSVAFAKNSASTPTIYHGMIYVGGSDGTWNQNSGIFAVIDLATFKLQKTYQVAGGVLSAPLVVENKDGKFYVYFTANTDQGFLYVYNAAEQKVEKAFVPGSAEAQYTTANPIVGPDGRIYYTTDAGAIVALQGGDLIEEYDLTIDRSQLPAAVKDVEISMLEPLHLLRHSTFSIVDRTDNMSMLYADEIKANIGDTKYIAFQTNFTGDVEGNPQIRLNITVDSTKFPLEKDQQFSLYKLQGKKFVPVTFRDTQAAIGMKNDGVSLMLAPRVFAAVMNGMMQTKGDQTIHFEQGLKDNATYLLAATPKKAEQPSGDKTESQPSETKGQTKPENSQQTEKTPAIVKTGEAVEYTAYIFVLGALIMLTARFSFRKSRKRK